MEGRSITMFDWSTGAGVSGVDLRYHKQLMVMKVRRWRGSI
jgi:hypothetical protein